MASALAALSGLFGLLSLIGGVMLAIQAWKDAWWKGLLCFCCLPYGLYYGFTVLQHEKKNIIMGIYTVGGVGGFIVNLLTQASM